MASIVPFIMPDDGSFDAATMHSMGEAFETTLKTLRSTAQPAIVYASIAARIIKAANQGERDSKRLQQVGLSALESLT